MSRRPSLFQCSSASRKFLNSDPPSDADRTRDFQCSSASRKFLNSSFSPGRCVNLRFQCSSASRKFLNRSNRRRAWRIARTFSALQRAENSSMEEPKMKTYRVWTFQCSSASRKFLNSSRAGTCRTDNVFQCSSASRKFLNYTTSVIAIHT